MGDTPVGPGPETDPAIPSAVRQRPQTSGSADRRAHVRMELLPEGGALPPVRPGPILEEPSVPSSRRDIERRAPGGLGGEAPTDRETYLP